MVRPVVAVLGVAFDEDGPGDPMARSGVGPEVFQHVVGAGDLPQVVVGVDDLLFRINDLLIDLGMPFGPVEGEGLAVCHGYRI